MQEAFDKKQHWEQIYQTKALEAVSWYQPKPETSLNLIQDLGIPKHASIIDIGGGDSLLVDNLLDLGYTDITVLDIAAKAIERAQKRLGHRADRVNWIVSDVLDLSTGRQYDFWHDRAAFHFLTAKDDVEQYVQKAQQHLSEKGKMVIATFSEQGPTKCSGIDIQQYSEAGITETMLSYFEKISCSVTNHATPFGTLQHFLFCSFQKR